MVERLSDAARQAAMFDLTQWQLEEPAEAIVRRFKFKDFSEAFAFMTRVALLADAAGHHPEWCNVYNNVTIRLTTHDARGLSEKDIALAHRIDALLG